MPKGGAVCLLIFRIMDWEISMKIKETDYFSICKIYAMLKVENERGNNVFRRFDGKG